MKIAEINKVLKERFHGVILRRKHEQATGECCVLELASVLRGLKWTDNPELVRCFDLRPLNDIKVPDELRTKYMVKLLEAYDGSLDWPLEKQLQAVEKIVIETVKQIMAELPGLPTEIREQCRRAENLDDARMAALAVNFRGMADLANASRVPKAMAVIAVDAAAGAAWEARKLKRRVEDIFKTACQIWIDAAV